MDPEISTELLHEAVETHGPWVDRSEYLYDDPTFNYRGGEISVRQDRNDGAYRPFWQDPVEHAMIRGQSRIVARSIATGTAVAEALTNYVVGKGFQYEVQIKGTNTQDEGLAQLCQGIVDEFVERCLDEPAQRNIHDSSREDGELLACLYPRVGGRCSMRLVTGEYLEEPYRARDFNDWLAYDEPVSWSYGVCTPQGDTTQHLGYLCQWDEAGADWTYFPAANARKAIQLRTGTGVMLRRNVPATVKRGMSDYYPVLQDLRNDARLVRNTVVGAALQAAIAWVEQYKASQTQVLQESGLRSESRTYQQTPLGSRQQDTRRYPPGSVVRVGQGKEYVAGPMGSDRIPNFGAASNLAARRIGLRWQFPAYLVTGDLSDANRASSEQATEPFIAAREADQRLYGRFHVDILWTVLDFALQGGRFARHGVSNLYELKRRIHVAAKYPLVMVNRSLDATNRRAAEHQAGILSLRTWAQEADRDFDAEQDSIKDEREQGLGLPQQPSFGGVPMGQGGPPAPGQPSPSGFVPPKPEPTPAVPPTGQKEQDRAEATELVKDGVKAAVQQLLGWENYP